MGQRLRVRTRSNRAGGGRTRGPPGEGISGDPPVSTLSAPRRRASALKRNCDVARCAVPRHLKLRAMVGRGGIHGSS
jgi:hypothetical protein